jgi:hypothetical protein
MKLIAFGVNIGNLGRGQRSREPMSARCNRINEYFAREGADLLVTAFYRHTGNLVLETASLQSEQAAAILSKAEGATWIAIPAEVLRAAVQKLSALPSPDPEDGVRWTPGLALAVTKPKIEHVSSTAKVRFRSLSLSIVAAWKRDRMTGQNRLDRKMREGGWGSVSTAVAVQTDSQWTARSLSSLQGVLERADEIRT